VIEHPFLADQTQRARAIELGVAIIVQHALLYTNGAEILSSWGPEPRRPGHARPLLAARGRNRCRRHRRGPPLRPDAQHLGVVTRETKDAGIQGADQAIDQSTANRALHERRRAPSAARRGAAARWSPARLADFVAFRTDPSTTPIDDLPSLKPILTVVGGHPAHDFEQLLS
jgi:predicted amidohydrolase YtcJ